MHAPQEQLGICFPIKQILIIKWDVFSGHFTAGITTVEQLSFYVALRNNCKLDGSSKKPMQEH